jgi:hypothetical protein
VTVGVTWWEWTLIAIPIWLAVATALGFLLGRVFYYASREGR